MLPYVALYENPVKLPSTQTFLIELLSSFSTSNRLNFFSLFYWGKNTMTEEESIIVRAAKILMAPTPPTPEPTPPTPAPTSEPGGPGVGGFFAALLVGGVILVGVNFDSIYSFFEVTR